MANHSATKKSIRKTVRRSEINKSRKSHIKTCIKKVLLAVSSGSVEAAAQNMHKAQSEIMKGAACGLIPKNTASRKVSRLVSKVKSMTKPDSKDQ